MTADSATQTNSEKLPEDFLKGKSQTDLALYLIYENPDISRENLSNLLCPLVLSVPSVPLVPFEGDKKDKRAEGDKGTRDFQGIFDNLKKILQRLEVSALIQSNKTQRPFTYSITEKGKSKVVSDLNHFEEGGFFGHEQYFTSVKIMEVAE